MRPGGPSHLRSGLSVQNRRACLEGSAEEERPLRGRRRPSLGRGYLSRCREFVREMDVVTDHLLLLELREAATAEPGELHPPNQKRILDHYSRPRTLLLQVQQSGQAASMALLRDAASAY